MKGLLFVISLPRSGSTHLQNLLCKHSQISSAPEPWLLLPLLNIFDTKDDLNTTSIYDYELAKAAVGELSKTLPNEFFLQNEIRELVIRVYSSLCRDDQYFLDKTPRYHNILPIISDLFPDAKFVFLTRDLYSIYSSMRNTWFYGTEVKSRELYHDLVHGPGNMLDSYKSLGKRALHIRYERLIEDQQGTLLEVLRFLDLDISGFHSGQEVSMTGRMGDKIGVKKFRNSGTKSSSLIFPSVFRITRPKYSKDVCAFFESNITVNFKPSFDLGVLYFLDFLISRLIRFLNIWPLVLLCKRRLKNEIRRTRGD